MSNNQKDKIMCKTHLQNQKSDCGLYDYQNNTVDSLKSAKVFTEAFADYRELFCLHIFLFSSEYTFVILM